MIRAIIGTVLMLISGAALVDGSAVWLVGVAVGAALVLDGINRLRKQD